jgi:hypothetical protein
MKKGAISLFVGCFFVAAPCIGIELSLKITGPEGIQFFLPPEWEALPQDVLDEYNEKLAENDSALVRYPVVCGFHLSSSDNWMDCPFISVIIENSGKVPEEDLESELQMEDVMDDSVSENENSPSSWIANLETEELVYDDSMHILWNTFEIEVSEGGNVKGITGALLTEEGVVRINCFALSRESEKYFPLFEEIIRNVVLPDHLIYLPHPPPLPEPAPNALRIRVEKALRMTLPGIILGGLIAWIITQANKYKRK